MMLNGSDMVSSELDVDATVKRLIEGFYANSCIKIAFISMAGSPSLCGWFQENESERLFEVPFKSCFVIA